MLIAGIDDAGRGSVIGPLVIAGVLLNERDLPTLTSLGVKDSKVLSPRRREKLAEEIKSLALRCRVIMLSPVEIDKVVRFGKKLHKLNRLEAQAMAKVIVALKPDMAYVDASDILADRFKQHIAEDISFKVQIVSEHKADTKYPIVSAASIVAKVRRDQTISMLQERYGETGCGYPTDPRTIEFLKNWVEEFGTYPDFVRKSWKTAKRLKAEAKAKQTKRS